MKVQDIRHFVPVQLAEDRACQPVKTNILAHHFSLIRDSKKGYFVIVKFAKRPWRRWYGDNGQVCLCDFGNSVIWWKHSSEAVVVSHLMFSHGVVRCHNSSTKASVLNAFPSSPNLSLENPGCRNHGYFREAYFFQIKVRADWGMLFCSFIH